MCNVMTSQIILDTYKYRNHQTIPRKIIKVYFYHFLLNMTDLFTYFTDLVQIQVLQ